ncbi:PREDICTED: mitochondrial import receptor subunit TOM20 homolog [Nicrophorus vespilloides]|uniref:Mitochondrial import receptor subunit TOM20 homolog n=1 Tax=Nicrophorus vespilloides TaxID=110193 RepID=A0ABM1N344_NICVS|nr:PREDICTED: mitochondrial import receptor subunit TOM20 homolog [Nicrophorus vespilloides]
MSSLTPSTALGIAAGVCGTLFLGYCIYFDHKRHKDPDFKKKLREKRRTKKASTTGKRTTTNFPNMKDHEAVQRFFLQEVQLGEELLGAGDLENGVDHLGNAVAVCGQPNELLQVLQQTLQPQVFHLLIQRLPQIAPRIVAQERQMQEDDVE